MLGGTVFAANVGSEFWVAQSLGNTLIREGEWYQNEIFRLSRVLRGISEKKVDPGKCPKPTLPHSSSILDIADLEFDISDQTITSAWISAFQSCQNFWNRPVGAKTVPVFVETVRFESALPPSANYPDNRLHMRIYIWKPKAVRTKVGLFLYTAI